METREEAWMIDRVFSNLHEQEKNCVEMFYMGWDDFNCLVTNKWWNFES